MDLNAGYPDTNGEIGTFLEGKGRFFGGMLHFSPLTGRSTIQRSKRTVFP
jgi:hypothetical protein